MLKLNLGCGQNKLDGYVNVDKVARFEPDVVLDLERPEWSWSAGGKLHTWAESSVGEVVLNHVLEHLGADQKVFLRIMQNLYFICAHGAVVQVNVPHPRHDNFIDDPTHVRIVTPGLLSLFSRSNCERWARMRAPNSPLALYLDVDFELSETRYRLAQPWAEMKDKGQIGPDQLDQAVCLHNNVIEEIRMKLTVIKPQKRSVTSR